jgi:hypothetical protein
VIGITLDGVEAGDLATAFWPAVKSFALPLIGCPTTAEKSALEPRHKKISSAAERSFLLREQRRGKFLGLLILIG